MNSTYSIWAVRFNSIAKIDIVYYTVQYTNFCRYNHTTVYFAADIFTVVCWYNMNIMCYNTFISDFLAAIFQFNSSVNFPPVITQQRFFNDDTQFSNRNFWTTFI
jgi:hypothetical protein